MTDTVDSHAPRMGAVLSINDQLLGWLRDRALTLWDVHGVDRVSGGYFESIECGAGASFSRSGSVRRGRVVARQIYAFDVGHRIGWRSRLTNPVEHGARYLYEHLHAGDGMFHTSVHAGNRQPADSFSLYEHAFYLFALARMAPAAGDLYPVGDTALRCLARLRAGWGRPDGGFNEAIPPTLPLKSNPHMHLLEAALAWIEVSEGDSRLPWIALAREIVSLCLTHFVDANTGAVREYFDSDWRPARGDLGRIVEPGHQFEWAWLLLEWASSGFMDDAARRACVNTAVRLMDVGERWGVDRVRGVAVNEIWEDMSVKDSSAKIWPQTERLKAWCARLATARTAEEAELASTRVAAAGLGLWQFLCVDPAGLWHEVRSADGSFVRGPSKASSFYHVVCAIDVLRRCVGALDSTGARPAGGVSTLASVRP